MYILRTIPYCGYFVSGFLNKPKIYNTAPLYKALQRRPRTVPLITVSNHHSCFDDPGLWGKVDLKLEVGYYNNPSCRRFPKIIREYCYILIFDNCDTTFVYIVAVMLSWRTLFCGRRMRWSLAAHDICFTNSFHSYFFMLGKCIPIVRGKGVFQVVAS